MRDAADQLAQRLDLLSAHHRQFGGLPGAFAFQEGQFGLARAAFGEVDPVGKIDRRGAGQHDHREGQQRQPEIGRYQFQMGGVERQHAQNRWADQKQRQQPAQQLAAGFGGQDDADPALPRLQQQQGDDQAQQADRGVQRHCRIDRVGEHRLGVEKVAQDRDRHHRQPQRGQGGQQDAVIAHRVWCQK